MYILYSVPHASLGLALYDNYYRVEYTLKNTYSYSQLQLYSISVDRSRTAYDESCTHVRIN